MPLMDQFASRDTSTPPSPNASSSGFDLNSIVPLIRRLQNEQENQHMRTATFDNNMSLRNNSIRARMDPFTGQERSPWEQPPTNTVFKDNNPDITPAQGQELGIKRQELSNQSLELKNKLGNEKFNQNLETQKLALDTKKNTQIYDTKQADMQRKIDEADQKLGVAYTKLQQNANDTAAHMAFSKAQMEATQARHELELAQKDSAHQETVRMNNAKIDEMQKRLDAASNKKVTTRVNPEGTERTTTTTSGKPTGKIKVIGPNGEKGTMDAEELKDFPNWKAAE